MSAFNHKPPSVHVDISTANTVEGNIDSEIASHKAFQAYLVFLYEHLLKGIYNLLHIGSMITEVYGEGVPQNNFC